MNSISNVLGGGGMIALALWWYYRYQRSQGSASTAADMWRSSQVMSIVAIAMFAWVAILVWSLK